MFGASGAVLQAAVAPPPPQAGAGGVGSSVMVETGDEDGRGSREGGGSDELGGGGERGFMSSGSGGNRWPRPETVALLKIRSEMDGEFRDSSLKGPLWEQVARKMAELGYHRSAKKCKEKFENVYKYHKRTKDGRATKSNNKTYRFFDELEAFEAHQNQSSLAAVPISMAMPAPQPPAPPSSVAVPLTTVAHTNLPPVQPAMPAIHQVPPYTQNTNAVSFASSPSGSASSSSSTSSDEEILGMKRKRKRKWKDFMERMMEEVMAKQEELQRKFLEAIEKREHDRMVRDEAWKVQEMARLNREHEILVQERSMAAAKDAALISFLQKISGQQQIQTTPATVQPQTQTQPQGPQPQPQPQTHPRPPAPSTPAPVPIPASFAITTTPPQQPSSNANGEPNSGYLPPSSSRWPKTEVEALIKLKRTLDQKYQDNAPKGPLWEEISSAMRKLGYNRNAKRCKEKWENINKYFKKVKESNRKRPEESKTCPYFQQLDELYREKNHGMKSHQPAAATAAPIMAHPEQQLRLPPRADCDDMDQDRDDEDYDRGDEDDDDDDQVGGFEIVANNNGTSMAGASAAAMQST